MLEKTDWKIAGASGLTVTVGTPEVEIEIGGSYLRLPLKQRSNGEQTMLQGGGAGVGVGLSISIPFLNASGSLDDFPSTGLGAIHKGWAAPDGAMTIDHFKGFATVVSMSGGDIGKSTQLSSVFFTKQPIEQCLDGCSMTEIAFILVDQGLSATPSTKGLALMMKTKAFGFFIGINVATHLAGIGADVYEYYLV